MDIKGGLEFALPDEKLQDFTDRLTWVTELGVSWIDGILSLQEILDEVRLTWLGFVDT